MKKVKSTKTVGMLVPNGEEEKEAMIIEEVAEVEPKDVVKGEEEKPCSKAYYQFNSMLATAPQVVQEEVAKIKAMPYRSGKQGQLQHMAVAFAKSGWNHTLFKNIEELDMHRSQQKKAKAYPRQVMVTKCGGEEGFEKASV